MKQVAYNFEFEGGFCCGLVFGAFDVLAACAEPVGGFSVNVANKFVSDCRLVLGSLLLPPVAEIAVVATPRLQLAN